LLGPQLIIDPADKWRTQESGMDYEPLVGSYGYANSKMCYTKETRRPVSCIGAHLGDHSPVMVSIFHYGEPIPPSEYISPGVAGYETVYVPEKALALWPDGHVKLSKVVAPQGAHFTWPGLFGWLRS
jgi:hypothetical protein